MGSLGIELELADGPPCPRCGCTDVEILRRCDPALKESWWPNGRARCRFCGLAFHFREVPAAAPAPAAAPSSPDAIAPNGHDAADSPVRYPVRGCPSCGSPETLVTSSPRATPGLPRVRRHRCRNCQAAFKSVDSRQVSNGH